MSYPTLPPLRLAAANLAAARSGRIVFSGVSFAAAPGAFVEITGPNGAGKTTLLRVLAGLLAPAKGEVQLSSNLGLLDAETRSGFVHLIGHRGAVRASVSIGANLRYWAGLFGQPRPSMAMLAQVGLPNVSEAPARMLSQGQQRRLALARLLVAPRPIWLLDEPAASLDRAGKLMLAELIDAHREAGGMVFAATHEPLDVTPTARVALGAAA